MTVSYYDMEYVMSTHFPDLLTEVVLERGPQNGCYYCCWSTWSSRDI